jgi:hypothetical protein
MLSAIKAEVSKDYYSAADILPPSHDYNCNCPTLVFADEFSFVCTLPVGGAKTLLCLGIRLGKISSNPEPDLSGSRSCLDQSVFMHFRC